MTVGSAASEVTGTSGKSRKKSSETKHKDSDATTVCEPELPSTSKETEEAHRIAISSGKSSPKEAVGDVLKKHRKKKQVLTGQDDEENIRSKREKKCMHDGEDKDRISDHEIPRASEQHDIEIDLGEPGGRSDVPPPALKEKKKRKKEIDTEGETEFPKKEKKRRKKRKVDDTGHLLLDPRGDTALSDQARKALFYAFSQFNDPKSWKFNKARQNWLLRNLWSAQTIPETYIPLLTKYLAHVQGGVRQNLMDACNALLAIQDSTQQDPTQASSDPDLATAEATKRARSQAILTALSANNPD